MADPKKNETTQDQGPSKIQKLLPILFAVLNLSVSGGGAFLVYKSTLGWQNPKLTEEDLYKDMEAEQENSSHVPLIYTMDKVTVNLFGEPKRSIRVEINLEMLGKEGFEEVMHPDNRARAKDAIYNILNAKTFDELESIQGKLFLKDQIIASMNKILHEGVVKDVYFTDFVVQ